MHAIMSCAAASSPDAGRLPLFAPIPIRPLHIATISFLAALDAQVINDAKDTPVAASPVPLKRKRARFTQDDLVLADQAILEDTKPRPAQEDLVRAGLSLPSSLQRSRTINKLEDLERQGALSGDISSGDDSIVLAEPETSSLKRARRINKLAGLDILKRLKSRKARPFDGPILQAYLRP